MSPSVCLPASYPPPPPPNTPCSLVLQLYMLLCCPRGCNSMACDPRACGQVHCMPSAHQLAAHCSSSPQLLVPTNVSPAPSLVQVRLQALQCVEALLTEPLGGTAAPSPFGVLREQESAPLLGHMASLLLQVCDERGSLGPVVLLGGDSFIGAGLLAAGMPNKPLVCCQFWRWSIIQPVSSQQVRVCCWARVVCCPSMSAG